MPAYEICGAILSSDTALPELRERMWSDRAPAPVVHSRFHTSREISFDPSATFARADLADGQEWLLCVRCNDGYLLRFPAIADFFVTERGNSIECRATFGEVSPEALRHLLLDAVIPRVLDLIGIESMHATAVLTEYGACAFIGPGGTGKSTLAASFALAGFPLLGDDCVVLNVSGTDRILLTPGYSGTRLWNDSLEALRVDPARSHAIAGYSSKRRAPDFHLSFLSQPQRLTRIFRLSRYDDRDSAATLPRIEPLSPGEAFIELASASYRFNPTDRAANLRKFRFREHSLAYRG